MCERGKADLYKDGPRTTRRELLLPTKLPQPFIAYSEVVTNLVDYGPSHRDHDLFLGLAAAADWILVDGDAVRKCTGVVPPFCERYSLVETQYVVSVAPLFDHDSDVGHLVPEFARDGVQRVGNQLLESVARDRHHRSKVARSPSPEGSRLCWRNVARSNTEASVGAVSGWRGHLPAACTMIDSSTVASIYVWFLVARLICTSHKAAVPAKSFAARASSGVPSGFSPK